MAIKPSTRKPATQTVVMLTSMAGERWSVQPKDYVACDRAFAGRLIDSGAARALETGETVDSEKIRTITNK